MALATVKEEIIDARYSRTLEAWNYKSKILGIILIIPSLFVYDHESEGPLRGSSKRAGLVHDYLCRFDSAPVVDKLTAAQVYLEVLRKQKVSRWRRGLKFAVVCVWRGYFHKFRVYATYEDITGRKWPTS